MPSPEEVAREKIDKLLIDCGSVFKIAAQSILGNHANLSE